MGRRPAAWIAALLLTAGCAKPTLVGNWQGATDKESARFAFRGDGTFTRQETVIGLGKNREVVSAGTYQIDGSTLRLTMTSLTVDDVDAMQKAPDSLKNVAITFTLEGDALTLTQGETRLPLKRIP